MNGIGLVAVRQPLVRDREAHAADPGRIRFSPSVLPPYMRRSKSIETLLPILSLKGISTGNFSKALAALRGKDAAGLSASAIAPKVGWPRRCDQQPPDSQADWIRVGGNVSRKELARVTYGARESGTGAICHST
jgi:hypothetical protein